MAVIRQLKNFFTNNIIYPKTLTKAVYDENGERLDKILRDTMLATDSVEYSGVEPRDADTLGGRYSADDISAIEDNLIDVNNSLDELNSNLTWKLLAENVAVKTNTNTVSGAREYYVVATYGTINITTLIPSIVLGKTIFDGYYSSASDNARIEIYTWTSSISLANFIYGGSAKDDATYSVYYR